MTSDRFNTIESFLDGHPEFLAQYLQKKMQSAVTNYLETNPKFLSEYLKCKVRSDTSLLENRNEMKLISLENASNIKSQHSTTPRKPKAALQNSLSNSSNKLPAIGTVKPLIRKELPVRILPEVKERKSKGLHKSNSDSYKKERSRSSFSPSMRRSLSIFRKRYLREDAILLELAREISTAEGSDQFCFKALQHVSKLLDAERCSLFWLRDSAKGDSKELASRLWNITPKSTFEDVICDSKNELVVPVDVGIAGLVVTTQKPINVTGVYEHPNFNKTIDEKTGFESRDLLCQPIVLSKENKVIGVVEVVNKKSKQPFTEKDENILDHFLVFCGLAIQDQRSTAQVLRLEQAAKLQEVLSGRVANLWSSLSFDDVLKDMVLQVSELIVCERYTLAVALVDNCNIEGCLLFAKSYDMLIQKPKGGLFDDDVEPVKNVEVNKLKKNDWVFTQKVIQKAISTREVVNMSKITPFSEYKLEDEKKGFSLKSALTCAFYDGADRLLGVLQLGNKKRGFVENDEQIIKSIRPYLMNGLLFANSFNSIVINKAKTDVADNIVRFHTRATQEEVDRIITEPIPEGEKYNLYEFSFSDLYMTDDETVLGGMRMFEDLDAFNLFKIRKETMLRWIVSVRRCYRPVYYHNWRHGLNVAHTMFLLLDRMKKDTNTPGFPTTFTDREKFTLVVACFCHDIDHRGTNNAFLIRAGAPLAILYNTSTLENHHYDTCLRISNMEGNNIFESFTGEEFAASCEMMKHAILATDLALYFQRRNNFKKLLEKPFVERDFAGPNRMLLMSMMMTACDLSSITKPWEVQQKMAKLVTSEFFDQGDMERKLFGTEPMPMMDRSKIGDLPKMQIGFIDGVCSMAFQMMAEVCPGYAPLRDGMMSNRQSWKNVALEQGQDLDAPKKKDTKEEDIGNMWEKYFSMDPENFIWGIDPNEKPPEVVIERVVFSPKKKAKPNESSISEENGKSRKKRRNKIASETSSQATDSEGKSKMCLVM